PRTVCSTVRSASDGSARASHSRNAAIADASCDYPCKAAAGVRRPSLPDIPYFLPLIVAVFILAGAVKGVLGGGLPSISIGLLSAVMLVPLAAALVVAPSFATNVWQSFGPHFRVLMRRIWLMLAGICVGAWLGAGLMTGAYAAWTQVGLGVSLAVYALIGLFNLRMS